MQDRTQPMSRRESYTPTRLTRFFWWLSTAEPEILSDCMIDRNRYAIVGMSVLGTWAFATLAWTYFFSTVVNSVIAAVLLGLFMGGIILSIDRTLIKGISRSNKRRWMPVLFRVTLAGVIGLFMAQPALLYLFDKEIHVQISLDNEQKKKDKLQKQDSSYYALRTPLLQKKEKLQKELSSRYEEVAAARNAFISETDGTGGSKKIGLKDIAQAKQKEYLQLDADYRQKQNENLPQIKQADSTLAVIDLSERKEQAAFEALLNDGFITRIEALNHLVSNNPSVAYRYYLLVMILLLIELMPVLAKTLLPEGTYERKIQLREENEKELTENNHQRELALLELYNQTAFEQDSVFIKDFMDESAAERKEKMKAVVQDWKKETEESFDSIWEKMKKEMLTKQEG